MQGAVAGRLLHRHGAQEAPPDRMTRPAVQSAGEEGDFAHDDCTLTPSLSPSKLLSTDLLSVLFP